MELHRRTRRTGQRPSMRYSFQSSPDPEIGCNWGWDIMPLKKSASKAAVSANIRELHQGPQYERTKKKFGKADADRQAVAVALETQRRAKKK
jgi:hypothetical protein